MRTLASVLRDMVGRRKKWLPRAEWEAKLRREGKWIDYKRSNCYSRSRSFDDENYSFNEVPPNS